MFIECIVQQNSKTIGANKKGNLKNKFMRAADKSKDQSYFLWTLNDKQLKKIIFPLQDLLKEEVQKNSIELQNVYTSLSKLSK